MNPKTKNRRRDRRPDWPLTPRPRTSSHRRTSSTCAERSVGPVSALGCIDETRPKRCRWLPPPTLDATCPRNAGQRT